MRNYPKRHPSRFFGEDAIRMAGEWAEALRKISPHHKEKSMNEKTKGILRLRRFLSCLTACE